MASNPTDPSSGSAVRPASSTTTFGCDECARRHSEHCSDCVVTYLCADDEGAVVVSLDEMRLVKRLQSVGLAPPLRHQSMDARPVSDVSEHAVLAAPGHAEVVVEGTA